MMKFSKPAIIAGAAALAICTSTPLRGVDAVDEIRNQQQAVMPGIGAVTGGFVINEDAAPSYSFIAFTSSTSNASSYTWTSHSLGTAATGRRIVTVSYGTGGAASTISTSIAGGAATNVVTATLQFSSPGEIAIRQVDSGTTGDIVLTFNGTQGAAGSAVYALYDLTSSTPVDTGSGTGTFNDTLNSTNPGIAIAGSFLVPTAGSTWTNLTEDHDTVVDAAAQHSSAAALTTASTINIQRTPTAASNNTTIAATFE